MKKRISFAILKRAILVPLALMLVEAAFTPAWGQSPPPAKFTSALLQAGDYPAGTDLVSLGTGDFNGDGKQDLVVAGSGNSHGSQCPIGIWLGNGDGTFTAPVSSQCFLRNANDGIDASTPRLLAVGDFNGDGKLDFAIYVFGAGSGTNYVDVYLGDGTGGFSLSNSYSVGTTGLAAAYEEAVVANDVNGDGKLDLIAINGGNDNTVTVLLGNGDGTFQTGVLYPACNIAGCYSNSLAIADFNGDGHPDLAIAGGSGMGAGVNILLNNGNGTFGAPVFYGGTPSIGLGCCGDSNPDVATADLRSDGKFDVVMTGQAGAWVFLGNGDGTFQAPVNYSFPWADSIAIADVNGDNKPDLIAADIFDSTVFILLGNGNGTFKPAVAYATEWSPQSFAIADFNGDKKLDFAIGSNSGPFLSVVLGNGDGTFRASANYGVDGAWNTPEVVADFNNDGNLDVAIANDQTLQIMLGSPHGVLGTPIVTQAATNNGNVVFMTAGDVNGDGKPDIVASIQGTTMEIGVYLGRGNGTFAAPAFYPTGSSANAGPVILADLSGNGRLDALVSNADGSLSVLPNKGKGVFGTARIITGVASGGEWLAAGDFNGDGKVDVVLADNGNNSLNVLLGNGNGTFQAPVKYTVQDNPQFVTTADLRNDGNLDLITGGFNVGNGNGGAGGIAVLLGNGDGTFGGAAYYNPFNGNENVNPQWATVADVNLDGKPDVLVAFYVTHTGSCCPVETPFNIGLGIFLGNGDGTLTYQAPPPVGTATSYIAGDGSDFVLAGDFNNDGAPDAVVLNIPGFGNLGNTGYVTMLLNTTLPLSISPQQMTFAPQTVDTTSKPETVLLTNDQAASLTLDSAALGGSDPGDFSFTPACPKTVLTGAHCTISLKFTPQATGSRTATLSIKDSLGTQTVNLSGTGK